MITIRSVATYASYAWSLWSAVFVLMTISAVRTRVTCHGLRIARPCMCSRPQPLNALRIARAEPRPHGARLPALRPFPPLGARALPFPECRCGRRPTPHPAALGPQVGRVDALSVDGAECPMAAGGMPQHRRVGAGWPAWSCSGELGVSSLRAAEPGTVLLNARASWWHRQRAPAGRWGIVTAGRERGRARACCDPGRRLSAACSLAVWPV